MREYYAKEACSLRARSVSLQACEPKNGNEHTLPVEFRRHHLSHVRLAHRNGWSMRKGLR